MKATATYTPGAGEHISHAIRGALKQAQELKTNVSFTFNDVFLVVTPKCKPEALERKWSRTFEANVTAHKRQPATVLADRAFKVKMKREQKKADYLCELLPSLLEARNLDALIDWINDFTPTVDWVDVKVDTAALLKAFEDAGYKANAHVGNPPEWFNTSERTGEYIIGQAMSCFARGMGPHPICTTFCEKYFALRG